MAYVAVTISILGTRATYDHNGWNCADTGVQEVLDAFTSTLYPGPEHGRIDLYVANQVIAKCPGAKIESITSDQKLPPDALP
jgi:hypothetical protein